MHRVTRRLVVAVAMGLALVGGAGGPGLAQEASPAATVAHPSHIHAGTCADLDPNPAYPLNDVAPVGDGAVESGQSTVDVTLDDLLASPYAINVRASADDIETYIACGDIAGTVVDGTLVIPLREQSDSGTSGLAVLAEAGAGTGVTVYLVPEPATPAASAAPAEAVEVAIVDFGFDQETVEIPVGTTVTWTNTGDVIHTTTSKDGLWDSAIMNTGDTFSYTFDTPGTYDYWCTLHPNMLGTVVVSAP